MRKKTIELENGQKIILREPSSDDVHHYTLFFKALPSEERMFMKEEEITDDIVAGKMNKLKKANFTCIIAEVKGEIVGEVSFIFPSKGWSSHVGELQLAVSRKYRDQGLGRSLLREITLEAAKKELHKIQVSILPKQKSAAKLLKSAGFFKEGTLENYIKDEAGKKQDLAIYGYSI